jgi:hypothetical protein
MIRFLPAGLLRLPTRTHRFPHHIHLAAFYAVGLLLSPLCEQSRQRLGLTLIWSTGLGYDKMPLVCSKRPTHSREAAERLVRPSRLACGRQDHKLP